MTAVDIVDEPAHTLPHVDHVVAHFLAGVDEDGDAERIGRRRRSKHLAGDAIFAHDEIGRCESLHRRAGAVHDAGEHGPFVGLRPQRSGTAGEHQDDTEQGDCGSGHKPLHRVRLLHLAPVEKL